MWAALGIMMVSAAARAGDPPATADRLRTDSRFPFVHRIGLYDEHGAAINPADKNAPPYSPMATCGKCHEVGTIAHGRHFNAADPGVEMGRNGEPWIYTDPSTGTQIPLSYRGWKGTYTPEKVGLSAWDIAKQFGRHLPGGGAMFPSEVSDPPGASRWPLSGGLEIDCLLCHSADNRHDPAERAKQIERENFRWIPTVAAGLAVVRGDASKLPDDFDPSLGPNPDYPDRVPPRLDYDKSRFDADNRVLLSITRRPSPDRCYFCHTTRYAPEETSGRHAWDHDQDVHLRAGMICVDCHRNGIDHDIVRGSEYGEENPNAWWLSCYGCHVGGWTASVGSPESRGGRLGAPVPRHEGIPPLHFQRIVCTTCHSGPYPWARQLAGRFQTSLNHVLGVPSRLRKDDDPPAVFGPVFLRDDRGIITPYRQIWPAFWGVAHGESVSPLDLNVVRKALAKSMKDADLLHTVSPGDQNGMIKNGLAQLAQQAVKELDEGAPVYVALGYVYTLSSPGEVTRKPARQVAPYAWPIAHDVRPATQALGAGGCTDCHSDDSPIDFRVVLPSQNSNDESAIHQPMAVLRGDNVRLVHAWVMSFKWRAAYKVFALSAIGIVALVIVAFGLRFVRVILGSAR